MNQKTLGIALAIVIIVGAVGYFTFMKKSSPAPTPAPTITYKTISWHDPENTILGFQFDIPNSWYEAPQSSEGLMQVSSCPPNTAECDYVYLNIMAGSVSQPGAYINNLVSGSIEKDYGYSKISTTVSGVPAYELVNKTYGDDRIIYFQKENEWYVFELYPGTKNKTEAYATLEKIVSTFKFTSAQTPTAPSAYQLFKDIDEWELSYQNKNYNSLMVCADGSKGDTSKGYTFGMNSNGYGDPPGDIDTPYQKVVNALKDNGWQQCKAIGQTELQDTQGTSEVFIKSNKLIGIFRHYSMGIGNLLWVSIQY